MLKMTLEGKDHREGARFWGIIDIQRPKKWEIEIVCRLNYRSREPNVETIPKYTTDPQSITKSDLIAPTRNLCPMDS